MIVLLKLIFVTSILVLGWKIVTNEGMGLEGVSVWASSRIEKGYKIFNLMVCPFCMPSLFSSFGYVFSIICGIVPLSIRTVLMYPIVVCGASIISGGGWVLLTMIMNINKYYEGLDMNNFQDPNDERIIDDEPKESYFIKRV